MNIQKGIPLLKTVLFLSELPTLQQLHRDFKLIGTVFGFKPYANDCCNINSEDADDIRA